MQKHERRCVEVIREGLEPLGWVLRMEMGGQTKWLVRLTRAGVRVSFKISNSPASRDHEVAHAHQFVRKVKREHP